MRIESMKLQSGETIALRSVTVVVGGNAVGKSTLLQEIYWKAVLANIAPTEFHWLEGVHLVEPDAKKAAGLLVASLAENMEMGNTATIQYMPTSYRAAARYADSNIASAHFEKLKAIASGSADGTALTTDPVYRRPFFALHPCDTRLNVAEVVDLTQMDRPPADTLNVLHRNPSLFSSVAARFKELFRSEVVLLNHLGTKLELRIADETIPGDLLAEPIPQERFRKIDRWKREHTTGLHQAGHGIRAMTNLLLSMFEPINGVILVDEPELFLYPTFKRALGRDLTKLAMEEDKQIIAVTHDASFLQGVLDTARDAGVHRLSLSGDLKTRRIQSCDLSRDLDLTAATKQREYLNALFYDRAVIVEGASDRAFYEGIRELYGLTLDREIGFVASGGLGGARNIAKLCQKVGVPYAYLFDFDAILPENLPHLSQAVETQGSTWNASGAAATMEKAIEEVGNSLGGPTSEERRKGARRLLKQRGVGTPGLSGSTKTELLHMVRSLKGFGIHLIDRGDMESWVPEIEAKARFAEAALSRLEQNHEIGQDVAAFLDSVLHGFANDTQ